MPGVSIFDIFKIGIGPSSSHTVGPMKAASAFVRQLEGAASGVARLRVTLHGSLAWTGIGHGTDTAIVLGLHGLQPESVDPADISALPARVREARLIDVPGVGRLPFDLETDLVFDYERQLPRHPNGMHFAAMAADGTEIAVADYYSLGGGFIARDDEPEDSAGRDEAPLGFDSGDTLLARCRSLEITIAELVLRNEAHWRPRAEVEAKIDDIWSAMQDCIDRGLHTDGTLPGRMAIRRRAPKLHRALSARTQPEPLDSLEWVNAFAIAVNEENAAGGRVVTAPTNGAAGIIPAVLKYYEQFVAGSDTAGIRRFLLTAGAIGILYKINASISGAEMGCQGEVGVACSMAAGGLVAALGGSNDHVEEAAEIGMEHNLGLTCDPVGGRVQIPCIERNAMGAVKAINAAKLALHGDGSHKVSLDQVIATMRQTGLDMAAQYKETSKGGLAVNVPEC